MPSFFSASHPSPLRQTRLSDKLYLAHTPTMRTPMDIRKTDNVYLAMWAMLLAVRKHNAAKKDIRTIACPGLGTGTGHVPPLEAARQMALAYEHFLEPPQEIDWDLALNRQNRVRFGGEFGFHIPDAQLEEPIN